MFANEVAPAFARLVEQTYSTQEAALICADLHKICALSGIEWEIVMRESDASFNPHVARVGTVLLEAGGVIACSTLRAALWCVLDQRQRSKGSDDPEVDMLLREIDNNGAEGVPLGRNAANIVAAIELDKVRHMHMTTLSSEQRKQFLNTARICASKRCLNSSPQLLKKLNHAIQLQERRLDT